MSRGPRKLSYSIVIRGIYLIDIPATYGVHLLVVE
jgi:hypothetical protein